MFDLYRCRHLLTSVISIPRVNASWRFLVKWTPGTNAQSPEDSRKRFLSEFPLTTLPFGSALESWRFDSTSDFVFNTAPVSLPFVSVRRPSSEKQAEQGGGGRLPSGGHPHCPLRKRVGEDDG